jgi:hypothetical protein
VKLSTPISTAVAFSVTQDTSAGAVAERLSAAQVATSMNDVTDAIRLVTVVVVCV